MITAEAGHASLLWLVMDKARKERDYSILVFNLDAVKLLYDRSTM